MGGFAQLLEGPVPCGSALVGSLAGRLGSFGPLGWLGTWLTGALLAVVAWRLCARAFARVEAVRGGSKCLL